MEFKMGDVVRPKSGRPDMSVEDVDERVMIGGQAVFCVWFEYVGRRQVVKRDSFPPEVLEIATPAEPIQFGIARG